MRPSLLDPLFAPVTSLAGVGLKVGEMIARIVPADVTDREVRAGDLLFTLPHSVIDRRSRPGIAYGAEGAIVTLDVRIDRHQPPPHGNKSVPYRVFAHDDTGEIALTFFHANNAWLEKSMPVGEKMVVSGKMEWFNGRPSMVHPDHIARADDAENLPLVEPVYPMTAGLSAKVLRRAIGQALARVPEMPEWLDEDVAPRRLGGCTILPTLSTSRPTVHRGAASLMTSSWPGRFRWRWCGRRCAGFQAGRSLETGASWRRCAAPCPTGSPIPRNRRWPRSTPILPNRSACCGFCRAMSVPARRWWR
jgi:RecG-like helicase